MLTARSAFSSISVDDIEKAKVIINEFLEKEGV